MPPIRVAIIVYNDVELLNFAGPLEVFTIASQPPRPRPCLLSADDRIASTPPAPPFTVSILAEHARVRTSPGSLTITRDIALFSAEGDDKQWDILVLPGGAGTLRQMDNLHLLDWVSRFARSRGVGARRKTILAVCTGTLILAKAAILEGMQVATHETGRQLLTEVIQDGGGEVVDDSLVVQALKGGAGEDLGVDVVTCAGVASGVEGALWVVKKVAGVECARGAAEWIEFDWRDRY